MNGFEDNKKYWEDRYAKGETRWDAGQVSVPLKAYIDQLTDKNLKILIPGCGNAYEAQYLYEQGFSNVFVIDLVQQALDSLIDRLPSFPRSHLLLGDFFEHDGQYDLILEQTFFCSLDPRLRSAYVKQAHNLLLPCGKLSGVLFEYELEEGPPYGGLRDEYENHFKPFFSIHTLESCYNSSEAWKGIELFIKFQKMSLL